MQTVLVLCLLCVLGILGYPNLNQDTSQMDEEHQKIVEDLQRRSVKCAKQKQKLGAEIKKLKKNLKACNKTVEEEEEMSQACKARNVEYLSKNQKITKERKELDVELKKISNENKELTEQLEKLKKMMKSTSNENKELIEALEECNRNKQDCQKSKQEADQKIEECSHEKEAQEKALTEQKDKMQDNESIIAACAQQNKIYQHNNDELESIAAELENNIERAQAKTTDLRSKLKEIRQPVVH